MGISIVWTQAGRYGISGLCEGSSWCCITKCETSSWFDFTRFCTTAIEIDKFSLHVFFVFIYSVQLLQKFSIHAADGPHKLLKVIIMNLDVNTSLKLNLCHSQICEISHSKDQQILW